MKVSLSGYNSDWVNLFQKEKKLIAERLGDNVVSVEHIGSTAVPGLGAKPIIDILLGVKKISDADEFIPKILELGYEYRNNFENVMPYRRYFTKPGYYHIHTVEVTSNFQRRHLLFRDYLRANDSVRDSYSNLKRELVEKEWDDINDYAYAKTEFIRKAEKDALSEFTYKIEKAECDGIYELYSNADPESKKLCEIKTNRLGIAALIQTEIYPRFSNNRVTGLGLEEPLNQKTIDKIKHFFSESKSRHTLTLVPSVITKDTESLLAANGYKPGSNWAIFYRDTSPIENARTAFEIKLIGKDYADAFAELVTGIYGFPAEMNKVFSSAIPLKNINYYMAFDKGVPAGAGCVYFGGDTAWFALAATLPEYRKRGVQSALLKVRIDDAKKRGCNWISVRTAEDTADNDSPSYRNMFRYGFILLYKRQNYVFEP